MAESDEFTPLIQRHVTMSAAELRAEAAAMKLELKNDIQDINQRSLRMETRM